MNKYTVKGVNKKTKEDMTLIVKAESKKNALVKAEIDGIVPTSARRFLDVENKKPVVVKAATSGVFNFLEILLIFIYSCFFAVPLYVVKFTVFDMPSDPGLAGYVSVLVPLFLLWTFLKFRKNSKNKTNE